RSQVRPRAFGEARSGVIFRDPLFTPPRLLRRVGLRRQEGPLFAHRFPRRVGLEPALHQLPERLAGLRRRLVQALVQTALPLELPIRLRGGTSPSAGYSPAPARPAGTPSTA